MNTAPSVTSFLTLSAKLLYALQFHKQLSCDPPLSNSTSRIALGSSGAWGKRLCYFISLYASFPMFGSSCSQFLGWGLAQRPEKTDLLALLSAGKKAFRGISRLEKVSFNYLPLSNLNTGWELLVSLHKSSTKRISYSYG